MGRASIYLALCAILVAASSCSVTRYVPEGEYLLNKNVIRTDRETPRKERLKADELDKFVRQSPANKVLGTNLGISIYNMSDTSKNGFGNRLLRSIGTKPVILDPAQIERSVNNIEAYMRSRGYQDSDVEYDVEAKRRKATVTYRITQGTPYRIGNISYDFRDEFLRPIVLGDSANTLLHTGDIFDQGVLDAERSRISDYLRNRGYFDFTVNNIGYNAYPTAQEKVFDITVVVRQFLSGYNDMGEQEWENNKIYRIDSIFINPDYDPALAVADRNYYSELEAQDYNGLQVQSNGTPKVRGKVLRKAVNINPNDLYSYKDIQGVYSNLMRLGYFRSASIVLTPVDSMRSNAVTFIGGDDRYGQNETTQENYLRCNINCIPALRQSYKMDVEGSFSSNFYALGATLGYQNRNLLRGAELFDISLSGRYEFMRTAGVSGSFEIGGSTSVSFPRFITPFAVDPFNRRVNPRTKLELSLNYQHRPYYHRTLSGIKLTYSWSNRRYSSFMLRPVDINFIRMSYIDGGFLNSLQNPYLRNSYASQLVPGISGSFVFNTQLRHIDADVNSMVFRLNAETMGNLFGGVARIFSKPHTDAETGKEYYKIIGMRFSQYYRIDASLSSRIVLGSKTSFAYRILGGIGNSYGNSTSIPIDRLFFSGGSNSMRGWIARTLGPGTVPGHSSKYPSQVGNLKLEANAEFRFPIWYVFQGALFFDAGNIWFTGKSDYEDPALGKAAEFKLGKFYRELGFNTGLGLRLDFSRFIFRVDWGVKLHDPGKTVGGRWIDRFRFVDTALNFGVGYPF